MAVFDLSSIPLGNVLRDLGTYKGTLSASLCFVMMREKEIILAFC